MARRDCRSDDAQLTEVVLNSAGDDRRISNFIAMTGQVTAGWVQAIESFALSEKIFAPSEKIFAILLRVAPKKI